MSKNNEEKKIIIRMQIMNPTDIIESQSIIDNNAALNMSNSGKNPFFLSYDEHQYNYMKIKLNVIF